VEAGQSSSQTRADLPQPQGGHGAFRDAERSAGLFLVRVGDGPNRKLVGRRTGRVVGAVGWKRLALQDRRLEGIKPCKQVEGYAAGAVAYLALLVLAPPQLRRMA